VCALADRRKPCWICWTEWRARPESLLTATPESSTLERAGAGVLTQLTVQIPDDLAQRLSASGVDLSRRALEAWAADEYRKGFLYKTDLWRLFGFQTSGQIDAFLKAHDVYETYSVKDIESQVAGLIRLGV
jgi:post-segregation antitoxin (ccd killing protein)